MKRHSLFFKLFLGNLLLGGIIVALAGFVSYGLLNTHHHRQAQAYQDHLTRLAQQYFQRVWPEANEDFDGDCKRLMPQALPDSLPTEALADVPAHMRLTVIAADGRVLGDSQGDARQMENHKTPDRPEIIQALEGRDSWDIRRSATLRMDLRYLALPIRQDGQVVGVVRLAVPVQAIIESEGVVRGILLWAALAGVAIAAALGLLINWVWYAPLRQISHAARQIASGNLSARALVRGSSEVADLGKALNEMRSSMAGQMKVIAAQSENLQTVVANLREGVIATDRDGHIVFMNQAAIDLLAGGAGDITGQHLQRILRVADILDLYNQSQITGQSLSRQIETDFRGQRRYFDVHAAQLAGAGPNGIAALLVIRDVTDLARTATVKAEFVANASHELRTPLATIRAAVDSLESIEPGDTASFNKFLAILDRHVKRLENLTNDLLDLHIVESGRTKPRLETIELDALADWARAYFADPAQQKGVRLDVKAPEAGATLQSDRILVELILKNLLDNAVKFTPQGGQVECRLQRQSGQVLMQVSDTGCGIPPEAQTRVFERFFQADSSRSGDARTRGTGLGLAIVKHACERLGAKVTLKSEVGKGTTVLVTMADQA